MKMTEDEVRREMARLDGYTVTHTPHKVAGWADHWVLQHPERQSIPGASEEDAWLQSPEYLTDFGAVERVAVKQFYSYEITTNLYGDNPGTTAYVWKYTTPPAKGFHKTYTAFALCLAIVSAARGERVELEENEDAQA